MISFILGKNLKINSYLGSSLTILNLGEYNDCVIDNFYKKRGVQIMCGFCRPIPRLVNNNCTVIVPAIPIQTGGSMAGSSTACGAIPMNGGAISCGGTPMSEGIIPSGTMPSGIPSGFVCNANFKTVQCVMEPPLQCAPTVIHHHNRIQHFVPCIKTNIHHVHNHNEFIPFEQSERNQVVTHSHGVRPSDQELCNSVR